MARSSAAALPQSIGTMATPRKQRNEPVRLQIVDKVERTILHEQVYQQIRDAIIAGRIAPGMSITIRALADDLGTSPMPVREALGRLVAERVLDMRQNRTVQLPVMTADKFIQLRLMRMELEGRATQEATVRITDADVKTLVQLNEDLRKGGGSNVEVATEKSRAFHFHLYRLSGMPLLVSTIETLWLQSGPLIRLMHPETVSGTAINYHTRILTALKRRDPKAARAAIERDLFESGEVILAQLSSDGTSKLSSPAKRGSVTKQRR